MYDELVKMLRTCALIHGQCAVCYYHGNPCNALTEIPLAQAADAIEELKKALDAVNDAHNEGYDVGYWAGRRDYEPKWIPVTERLPGIDDGDWVLGVVNGFAYGIVYKNAIVTVEYYENSGCWSLHDLDAKVTVTHWMPLPEPPEEVAP